MVSFLYHLKFILQITHIIFSIISKCCNNVDTTIVAIYKNRMLSASWDCTQYFHFLASLWELCKPLFIFSKASVLASPLLYLSDWKGPQSVLTSCFPCLVIPPGLARLLPNMNGGRRGSRGRGIHFRWSQRAPWAPCWEELGRTPHPIPAQGCQRRISQRSPELGSQGWLHSLPLTSSWEAFPNRKMHEVVKYFPMSGWSFPFPILISLCLVWFRWWFKKRKKSRSLTVYIFFFQFETSCSTSK